MVVEQLVASLAALLLLLLANLLIGSIAKEAALQRKRRIELVEDRPVVRAAAQGIIEAND